MRDRTKLKKQLRAIETRETIHREKIERHIFKQLQNFHRNQKLNLINIYQNELILDNKRKKDDA